MLVRVEGRLRWTDLLKSQYLHLRPRPSFAAIGVVLLLLFGWGSLESTARWTTGAGSWILPAGFLLGFLYFAIYFAIALPVHAHRIFIQQKSLNVPFSIEASPETFSTFNEFGRTSMPWSNYVKWKENRELFLLYHSDALFSVIPKRFFESRAQLEEFRAFLVDLRRVR